MFEARTEWLRVILRHWNHTNETFTLSFHLQILLRLTCFITYFLPIETFPHKPTCQSHQIRNLHGPNTRPEWIRMDRRQTGLGDLLTVKALIAPKVRLIVAMIHDGFCFFFRWGWWWLMSLKQYNINTGAKRCGPEVFKVYRNGFYFSSIGYQWFDDSQNIRCIARWSGGSFRDKLHMKFVLHQQNLPVW